MAIIDKKYHGLLNHILARGFRYEDPNRKGTYRVQIPSCQIEYNFDDGFPAITTKKLYWKGVVGELLWFLRGSSNPKYLIDNGIGIWDKDAINWWNKLNPDKKINSISEYRRLIKSNSKILKDFTLGMIYPEQWRGFNITDTFGLSKQEASYLKIDQISNLIKGLKKTPMGTRHIVTAWNPAELDDMALPPCHWSFEILVEPISLIKRLHDNRNNIFLNKELNKNIQPKYQKKLLTKFKIPEYQFTLKWHQRSCDSFLGIPFNIASYALLAHIIGKMTNMVPKGIIGDLSNVHIYEDHIDAVKEQLKNDVNKYDDCKIDIVDRFVYNNGTPVSKAIDLLKISEFNLNNYGSYPAIPAEMIPYKK